MGVYVGKKALKCYAGIVFLLRISFFYAPKIFIVSFLVMYECMYAISNDLLLSFNIITTVNRAKVVIVNNYL